MKIDGEFQFTQFHEFKTNYTNWALISRVAGFIAASPGRFEQPIYSFEDVSFAALPLAKANGKGYIFEQLTMQIRAVSFAVDFSQRI